MQQLALDDAKTALLGGVTRATSEARDTAQQNLNEHNKKDVLPNQEYKVTLIGFLVRVTLMMIVQN